MMQRLKAWWPRRPRLRRGQKIIVNLAVCAALVLVFWGQNNYPLPTAEMEFRRLERMNLLSKSEIVFELDGGNTWVNSMRRQKMDILVGRTKEHAAVGYINRGLGYLECWPLDSQPTPVPLAALIPRGDQEGQPRYGNGLLFMQIPQQAHVAILKVWGWEGQANRESWTQGDRLDKGDFYFWISFPDGGGTSNELAGTSYLLTLYERDGTVLLEQTGTVPPH